MAKFYGPVGYGVTAEIPEGSGIWKDTMVAYNYAGDVLQNYRKNSAGESINDNLDLSNKISILADPFAMRNFQNIRYVKWMGAYWKVGTIEVRYPRLILTIGGVYNGETVEPSPKAS